MPQRREIIGRTLLLVGWILVCVTSVQAQGLEDGMAALATGDYPKALSILKPLAEEGDAEAQFNLGVMYDDAEDILENDMKAVRWYRKAAEQGHAPAQYRLGILYANASRLSEDDPREMMRWLRKAAEQGYADAEYALGFIFANGVDNVEENRSQAADWYRKAAEQGHEPAQVNLGRMYVEGRGVPHDDVEAVRWYRMAAEQGNATAQSALAFMYANGNGVQKDEAEAVRWWRKAAKQGYAIAQNNLGVAYATGRVVTHSPSAAADWFYKAGRSFLEEHDRQQALVMVDAINKAAPGHFLTKKLLSEIYASDEGEASPDDSEGVSLGTGWRCEAGYVVTNNHVIAGAEKVFVRLPTGVTVDAKVVVADRANDLALLAVSAVKLRNVGALPIANDQVRAGTKVFTIGYPHPDVMGVAPKVTDGIVSAVSGIQNDPRTYQITVPLQSGNSGGPLINMNGEVVGIVTSKIDAVKIFEWTGDLPQNVNYAVKVTYLRALLDSSDRSNTSIGMLPRTRGTLEELAARIQKSVVIVVAEGAIGE